MTYIYKASGTVLTALTIGALTFSSLANAGPYVHYIPGKTVSTTQQHLAGGQHMMGQHTTPYASGLTSHSSSHSSVNTTSSSTHHMSASNSYAARPVRVEMFNTTSTTQTACPAGSHRGVDGLCMSNSNSFSTTTVNSNLRSTATRTPQISTGYIARAPQKRVVPFSTGVSSISNYRIPGMGANEHLCPTQCPVSVLNPEGGKVLGCYEVCSPVPAPVVVPQRQVRVVHPIIPVPYPVPVKVQVVHPVIYVRYPVPTPAPVYVQPRPAPYPVCGLNQTYSRYGENWPTSTCG